MIDRLLKIHLEPIAREQRRGRLLRALAFGWLAVAGIGVLFIFARLSSGWRSPWTFLVLLAAALVWTIIALIRNREREADYIAIARQIELQNPELHTILLTAIEQQPDAATGELNFLQERLIREALAKDRERTWRAGAAQRLALARLSGAAALVVLIGVLSSLYQVAPPRAALMALAGQSVTVTPGDASVERNTSLVVLAKFEGDVPTEATLVVRPANEPERRIPLTKNLQDPVFGTSLPEVKGELTYRLEYGDKQTKDFKVTTFEYPRLERADAKVTYPEYTGLKEKTIEDTKRVSAVEGSGLDYTFHLNKAVKSAKLVSVASKGKSTSINAKSPPPPEGGYDLAIDKDRTNVRLLSTKLEKSGRYELLLVDDDGRTNRMPPQFVFEALTNRTPDLKFAFPKGDQRVSALEEIAFKAEASDDFGLKAYGIAYNLAGQEPKFVELGQAAAAHEKRAFDKLVPLEELEAHPDELLSYYVWADDVGPDGEVRRTASDMFFAEVRPFDEIFREGQGQDGNSQQQQQQQQQGQGQNQAEKLAELQKEIINATWNLQRRENRKTPSDNYKSDAAVVKESQEDALEQLRERKASVDDPRANVMLEAVEKEMQKAAEQLASAADKNSVQPLPPALAAEQSAYQALLRLAEREYQVSRSQRQQGQSSQSSRGQRAQRQLNQLDLKQSENKYETQRQAAPQQDPKQREQLQAFNRLKELAQRQQDVNERLKELQAALAEAKTVAEREELQNRLIRLQEEQQQMLADVDELRQRMERPENQAEMQQARQQLEETRDEVQRAAEAMNKGEVSQALSSGTRAQRDLQQMRDDFRKENASQFAEDMRTMRNAARDLAQKQEEIGQKMDSLADPKERKSLTDSDERQDLAKQLEAQKQRMEEVVKQATEVTEKAEAVEPLLARQLYDTLRKAAQADGKNLQDTREDLAGQGRLRQNVDDYLKTAKDKSVRTVEAAAELLREGFSAEANNLEERARQSINDFKGGVEHAAQTVLGDDTEALRRAQRELDDLAPQLEILL